MLNCEYVQFSWFSPDGERIRTGADIIAADWVRTTNNLGSARVEVDAKNYDFERFTRQDLGLLIEGGTPLVPDLDTFWFLRGFDESRAGKAESITLLFEDTISLLNRRIVSLPADDPRGSEPRTRLSGAGNRAMADLVEDVINLTSFNRYWADNLLIGPVISPSPPISMEVPYQNLLRACQKITRASLDKGTPLFFDILYSPQYNFTFQTFTGQRGALHSETIHTNHPSFVLDSFSVSYNVPNTGYVGGSGKGEGRKVAVIQDESAANSTFGAYEVFKSTNLNDFDALEDEAREIVNSASGKVTLSGKLLGDLSTKYGWGDRVNVSHRGIVVECVISSVSTSYSKDTDIDRNVTIRSLEQ